MIACVPTGYCGLTGEADGLEWGVSDTTTKIVGKIDCSDGKKEDNNTI
jgi:hypothetical protein